jgi:hypothetical protein
MVLKTFLTFVITSLHLFIAEISDKGAKNGDEKATQADDKGDGGVSWEHWGCGEWEMNWKEDWCSVQKAGWVWYIVPMFKLGIAEGFYILEWNFCILTIGTEDKTPTGELRAMGLLDFDSEALFNLLVEDQIELLALEST